MHGYDRAGDSGEKRIADDNMRIWRADANRLIAPSQSYLNGVVFNHIRTYSSSASGPELDSSSTYLPFFEPHFWHLNPW